MTNTGRFTEQSAREAGRRSAEARRRRKDLSPEERALEAIDDKLGRLTKELIDAALGEGDFDNLKLDTRVTALTRLMEWRLGRPGSVKPKEEAEAPSVPADGEALFE